VQNTLDGINRSSLASVFNGSLTGAKERQKGKKERQKGKKKVTQVDSEHQ
jgi:hypothetical protein